MRFKNFLNENSNLEEIFSLIEKDCKPFLRDIKKIGKFDNFLYSGRKRTNNWFKGKVRKDRTPRDMPEEIHNQLNKLFKEKFGVKARSESLFITADCYSTYKYGNPYIIFPIGKYKIIWHPNISDLWTYILKKYPEWYDKREDKEETLKLLVNKYQEGNLKLFLQKDNEGMLICDEFYAIKFNSFTLENISNFLNKK